MTDKIIIEERVLDGDQVGPVVVEIDTKEFVGSVEVQDSLLDGTGSEIVVEVSESLGVVGIDDLVEVKKEIDNSVIKAESSVKEAQRQIDKANQTIEDLTAISTQINNLVDTAKVAATTSTNNANNAKVSETNAKTSETNAKASEANAKASQTAAAGSVTTAASSASAAAGSATAAANSAGDAAGQAQAAATYAQNSANSATLANTHKEAAKAAQLEAEKAETAAKVSEAASLANAGNAYASQLASKASEDKANQYQAAAANSAAKAEASASSMNQSVAAATAAKDDAEAAKLASENARDTSIAKADIATQKAQTATTSAAEALASKDAASISENNAKVSETNAKGSETNASASALASATSASSAQDAATSATSSAKEADTAAKAAQASQVAAANSASAAAASSQTANTAATNASTSAQQAEASNQAAKTAQTAAETAQNAAQNAQTATEISRNAAKASETNAASSATTATQKATAAGNSATSAANSATQAAQSTVEAKASQGAAKVSETKAAGSATAASTSAATASDAATRSQAFASDASAAQLEAEKARDAAKASQVAAKSSEVAATSAKTAAKASEVAATSKAADSANSATASANSATASANSATASANSASQASVSAAAAKKSRDEAESFAEELRKGSVYRGIWNPNSGSYPAVPPTNSRWDVQLNKGQLEKVFDGKTWNWGDRLIYILDTKSFDIIDSGTGVTSVNGDAGAVTVTPTSIGAVKKSGDTMTGSLAVPSLTGIRFIKDPEGNIVTFFGAEGGNGTYIGSVNRWNRLFAKDGLVQVMDQNNKITRVYHEGHKPTPAEVGALPSTGGTISGNTETTGEAKAGKFSLRGLTSSIKDVLTAAAKVLTIGNSGLDRVDVQATDFTHKGSKVYTESNKPTAYDMEAVAQGDGWHKYSREYVASQSSSPVILGYDAKPLKLADKAYYIRVYTAGTGTKTGAVYLLSGIEAAVAGSVPELSVVAKMGSGSNHPELFLDNNVLKLRSVHPNQYRFNVIIEEVDNNCNPWVDITSAYSTTNKPSWDAITNKPAYATRWPNWGEVGGAPETAKRWPTFDEVTNKPAYATRWPNAAEVGALSTAGGTVSGNIRVATTGDAELRLDAGVNKDSNIYLTEDSKNQGFYINYRGAGDNATHLGTINGGVEKAALRFVRETAQPRFIIAPVSEAAQSTENGALTRKDWVENNFLKTTGGELTGDLILRETNPADTYSKELKFQNTEFSAGVDLAKHGNLRFINRNDNTVPFEMSMSDGTLLLNKGGINIVNGTLRLNKPIYIGGTTSGEQILYADSGNSYFGTSVRKSVMYGNALDVHPNTIFKGNVVVDGETTLKGKITDKVQVRNHVINVAQFATTGTPQYAYIKTNVNYGAAKMFSLHIKGVGAYASGYTSPFNLEIGWYYYSGNVYGPSAYYTGAQANSNPIYVVNDGGKFAFAIPSGYYNKFTVELVNGLGAGNFTDGELASWTATEKTAEQMEAFTTKTKFTASYHYSSNRKPTWEDVGGDDYIKATDGHWQVGSNNWLRAAHTSTGFLPATPSETGDNNSFIGTHGWRFREAWVKTYRGTNVYVTDSIVGGNASLFRSSNTGNGTMFGAEGATHRALVGVSSIANEYLFGGSSTGSTGFDGDSYIRIGKNKLQFVDKDIYHEGNKPALEDIAAPSTITKDLKLTANTWTTLLTKADFPKGNGVYQILVQYYSSGKGGSAYTENYTGQLYWFSSNTNQSNVAEIPLHHMGHADGGEYIYLRTQTRTGNKGDQTVDIKSNKTYSSAVTFTVKLVKIM